MAAISCKTNPTDCDIFFQNKKDGTQGLFVGLGNGRSTIGFQASTSTSPGSGAFQWIQIVTKDDLTYAIKGYPKRKCVTTAGLDTMYPASNTNTITDSPDAPVTQDTISISRSFLAHSYLMWTPNGLNSIPIPLGSVTWGFDESSQRDNTQPFGPLGWTTPTVTAHPGSFVPSTSYPTWQSLATFITPCPVVE